MITILQALGFMLLGATISEWYNWRIRLAMIDRQKRQKGQHYDYHQ